MTPTVDTLTAAILVGGLGTRLRPVLGDRLPKPMAPVLGRPFLELLVDSLCRQGIRDFVFCVGHGADMVRDHFGDGSQWSIRVRYSDEPKPLGTAGALANALSEITSDPFLAMNGDSFCPFDARSLLASHLATGATATLLGVEVDDLSRYGSLQIGPENRILSFDEKGSRTGKGIISAGVYLLNRSAMTDVPADRTTSIEYDVFPRLAGKNLFAHVVKGPFIDIGTPESFRAAADFFTLNNQ